MKTTRYFEDQVLRKRPYIRREWCAAVMANPIHRERQSDGHIRFWGEVMRPDEAKSPILRVVTPDDGEAVHSAIF